MADLKHIEREAAAERQDFAKSLDTLSLALSPENLKAHATSLVDHYGHDIAGQAWQAARTNPAGFALMGAGIGLLLMGTGARPEQAPRSNTTHPMPEDAFHGFDARVAAADAAMPSQKEPSMVQPTSSHPTAKWLRDRIEDGLDSLPPKARLRVREARQAAVNAQEKIEDQMRRTASKSSATMQRHPLAVGAVALGVGALIGALLPSSRREDALLGEHRDRVMAKAQSVLNEELDKLQATAKSALNGAAASAEMSAGSHDRIGRA